MTYRDEVEALRARVANLEERAEEAHEAEVRLEQENQRLRAREAARYHGGDDVTARRPGVHPPVKLPPSGGDGGYPFGAPPGRAASPTPKPARGYPLGPADDPQIFEARQAAAEAFRELAARDRRILLRRLFAAAKVLGGLAVLTILALVCMRCLP